MARSNRTNSEYGTYIRHRPPVAQLGNVGLAVFRSFERRQFDSVFETLEDVLGETVIRTRGVGMEKPPGVTMLEIGEVKRQRSLGRVPVAAAIDELYESVGSLRKTKVVAPARIQFLGRGIHRAKALVASFDASSVELITAERKQMLETLEGLANHPTEFSWLEHMRPHITLARLSPSQVEKATIELRLKIEESLPDTITLNRATIYNPHRVYGMPPSA